MWGNRVSPRPCPREGEGAARPQEGLGGLRPIGANLAHMTNRRSHQPAVASQVACVRRYTHSRMSVS